MKLRPMVLMLALVIHTIAQLGCTLGYNGAWLVTPEDRQTAEKYQQFVAQRKIALKQAADERQVRSNAARFDGPGPRSRMASAQSERLAQKPVIAPAAAEDSPAPRSRTAEFLYGQLGSHRPSLSSPMDGVGNLQQITFATEGADYDPALDRTGRRLVYSSTQHRPTSDLYIKAVDGTAIRQLTDDPANDATPAFSPDGKWIIYSSKRTGNWDLYRMSVDGGPSQELTNSPNDDIYPSFSPDGKQIVYCTLGSMSGQWELAVVDVDSPSAPRIIGHGLFPQWSPVDNRIVYQRARERGSRHFGVWVIELENGEGVRPTQIAASSNAAAITPRWSPDGKSIVFCTIVNPESDLQQGTPVQSDIWVVNADGTGRANLTRSRFANLQPVWAPDGSVYFVSNRGRNGMENIWAMRTEAAVKLVRSSFDPEPSQLTAEAPAQ